MVSKGELLRREWFRYYLRYYLGLDAANNSLSIAVQSLAKAASTTGIVLRDTPPNEGWKALGMWNHEQQKPTTIVYLLIQHENANNFHLMVGLIRTLPLTF